MFNLNTSSLCERKYNKEYNLYIELHFAEFGSVYQQVKIMQ